MYGILLRMKKRYGFLLSIILFLTANVKAVTASSSGSIPVTNQVVGDEKGFSAEDLKKFLEESGDLKEKGKGKKEDGSRQWKDYLTLSGNASKEDAYENDEADTDVSEKQEDKAENEEFAEKADDLYIPAAEDEWKIILVNKQNPIPYDYDAEIVDINGGAKIRREIALPLADMFEDAKEDGVSLMVCSAYRSHEYQERLFDKKIRTYTGRGLSYLDAFRIGSYSVIIPGTSEHELGMALDIVTPGYMTLDEGYAKTAAGKWLKENAYKYGFILRYPEGKEYITGIIFEPWHYRYVGEEAAKYLTENELTLEEYIKQLEYN